MMTLSLVQVVILLPLLALVTAWLYIQWAYHRQLSLARKLPTAIPAYPLIGHLLHMKTKYRVESQTWKLGSGHRSGLSCIWLGPVPWIMINKAEHMKVILNNSNSLGKAKVYDAAKWAAGNGLVTAPIKMWKISRKHINVLFHSENLQHFIPTINENARHLVEDLSEHIDKETFDCEDCLFTFSSINILKLLFGPDLEMDCKSEELKDISKDIKLQNDMLGEPLLALFEIIKASRHLYFVNKESQVIAFGILSLLRNSDQFADLVGERLFNPFLRSDTIYKLVVNQALNHMEVFRKKIEELSKKSQQQKGTVESNGQIERVKTFRSIFNLLKATDPIFNEDYMLSEIITLISAGTDTNAITMSNCLVALGSHPDIQKHLYEEIVSVVGESSGVDAEDISKMTYLDQVLKETLRCFTIVPLGARICDSDVQIDDYTIPEGTTVILSFGGLHTNEEVFPDPLRFDPDRFSPENCAKMHSYSFLPFSGGSRNCIGKNYAMMAMKITLVHLLKNYEITSNLDYKNITYKYTISMVNIDGYKISIKKRC